MLAAPVQLPCQWRGGSRPCSLQVHVLRWAESTTSSRKASSNFCTMCRPSYRNLPKALLHHPKGRRVMQIVMRSPSLSLSLEAFRSACRNPCSALAVLGFWLCHGRHKLLQKQCFHWSHRTIILTLCPSLLTNCMTTGYRSLEARP